MQTKFSLLVGFLLLVIVMAVGCKDSNAIKPKEEIEPTPEGTIIGRWKLIELMIDTIPHYEPIKHGVIDYSNSNIVYNFQTNNRLVVTGSIPNDLFMFDDFRAGEHFYEYEERNPNTMPYPNLLIDDPKFGDERGVYYCNFDNHVIGKDTMIIHTTGSEVNGIFIAWGKMLIKIK